MTLRFSSCEGEAGSDQWFRSIQSIIKRISAGTYLNKSANHLDR